MSSVAKPDFNQWPSTPFGDRSTLPEQAGVYAVISHDKVFYIGQSKNIRKRWQGHHLTGQMDLLNDTENLVIAWELHPKDNLRSIESQYIKALKPCMNAETERFAPKCKIISRMAEHLREIETMSLATLLSGQLTEHYNPLETWVLTLLQDQVEITNANHRKTVDDIWIRIDENFLRDNRLDTPNLKKALEESINALIEDGIVICRNGCEIAIAHEVNEEVA